MMPRFLILALILTGAVIAAAPQTLTKDGGGPGTPTPEEPQILRPAKQSDKPAPRALAWSLLIDPLDQIPGNAAQTWTRAGLAARNANYKWSEKQNTWDGPGDKGMPLDRLPLAEVKELLDKHGSALRAAGRAAHQSHCDWEYPPLTIQSLGDLSYDEIQMLRELNRLINLRCRVALAQDRFEDAAKDLQITLALARNVGNSQWLIQDLVGIAIASINLSRIDEWIQKPGSPNLYWPLTELPSPLIDIRPCIKYELATLYRSFPDIRRLKENKLTAAEANSVVEKLLATMARLSDEAGPDWKVKIGVNVLALKYHAAAKKTLIAQGRTEKEVEAIPMLQAVGLAMLTEYDRARDEFVRCVALPPWQGYFEIEKIEKTEIAKARANGNLAIALLMPAMLKVYNAQLRLDRNIAGLRAAEAIRLHVAKHGKPPAKLTDITEVPLPIDPFTGKGFEVWYSVKGDKAILDVPPPPQQSLRVGKRYEFSMQGR